jgi:ribosomal protein S18 acetylase RimI-like enzyme
MFKITPASAADISQIHFLESAIEGPGAASPRTLIARLAMFNEGFLVARRDAKVIGYIETCRWQRETPEFRTDPDFFANEHTGAGSILYIIFLAVEERQRRYGVGSQLVREVIKRVGVEFPVSRVQVVSRDPLLPFYQNLGFSALQQLPGFLPDGQQYTLLEYRLGYDSLAS